MFTAIKFEQFSNFYVDYKEKNSPYMNVMAQSYGFYSNEMKFGGSAMRNI